MSSRARIYIYILRGTFVAHRYTPLPIRSGPNKRHRRCFRKRAPCTMENGSVRSIVFFSFFFQRDLSSAFVCAVLHSHRNYYIIIFLYYNFPCYRRYDERSRIEAFCDSAFLSNRRKEGGNAHIYFATSSIYVHKIFFLIKTLRFSITSSIPPYQLTFHTFPSNCFLRRFTLNKSSLSFLYASVFPCCACHYVNECIICRFFFL